MEAVQDLQIRLDLSDRKAKYYDFVHNAVVIDPEEAKDKEPEGKGVKLGWIFKNDAHDLRVKYMYASHFLDKRFFENFAPTTSESNWLKGELKKEDLLYGGDYKVTNQKTLPNYVLPIYKEGDIAKGTVVLKLNKTLEAERLLINLLGRATVNVRIYHKYGYYDVTKHDVVIDESVVLWQSSKVRKDCEKKYMMLDQLDEGVHEIPFQFTIPEGAIPSVTPLVAKSHDYAYVSYRLKATVDRGRCLGKGNAVTDRGIWVNVPFNIADHKELLEPDTVEKTQSVGLFSSGNISYKATIARKGYSSEECVPLTLEIDNGSKDVIEEVTAMVRCKGRARTAMCVIAARVGFTHNAVATCSGPVSPGECPCYNWELPFDFKESFLDSCMIPSSEVSEMSQFIDFRYEVYIRLKRKGPFRDIQIIMPITVGTMNTSSLPSNKVKS